MGREQSVEQVEGRAGHRQAVGRQLRYSLPREGERGTHDVGRVDPTNNPTTDESSRRPESCSLEQIAYIPAELYDSERRRQGRIEQDEEVAERPPKALSAVRQRLRHLSISNVLTRRFDLRCELRLGSSGQESVAQLQAKIRQENLGQYHSVRSAVDAQASPSSS